MVWIKTAPSPVQKAREGILSPKQQLKLGGAKTTYPTSPSFFLNWNRFIITLFNLNFHYYIFISKVFP
jgi:hypothetical protein